MRHSKYLLSLALLLTAFSTNVSAADQWKHTLTPLYVWASGIEGNSQVGPVAAPVSIAFEDALDHLDETLTIHYEANKGAWGVMADYYHIKLAPRAVLSSGAKVGVDLTNNIYELGGIYRPTGVEGLDLLFGLRASDYSMDVDIKTLGAATVVDQDWVDFFAGIRKRFELTEKAGIALRGDIGAGDSDFVWNAHLSLGYRFSPMVSMLAGYRWLDYDYKTGSGRDRFVYDVTYQGPTLALSFNW